MSKASKWFGRSLREAVLRQGPLGCPSDVRGGDVPSHVPPSDSRRIFGAVPHPLGVVTPGCPLLMGMLWWLVGALGGLESGAVVRGSQEQGGGGRAQGCHLGC